MPHKKIHAVIRKHAPKAFQSSKDKFHFKYPELFFLILSIFFAYLFFSNSEIFSWVSNLFATDVYLGAFTAGILLAFGFTSAFGIGLFIALPPSNIFLISLMGGIGAMISDLIIFKVIRVSFKNEFEELKKTDVVRKINLIVKNHRHVVLRHYLFYAIAGIIIATPLPDEIGVSMLAGLTTIKPSIMTLISFVLHTMVIFLFLVLL